MSRWFVVTLTLAVLTALPSVLADDADGDLIDDSIEGEVCGRAFLADAIGMVNETAGTGQCVASDNFDSAYLDLAHEALCGIENSNSPHDGSCDAEGHYATPYPLRDCADGEMEPLQWAVARAYDTDCDGVRGDIELMWGCNPFDGDSTPDEPETCGIPFELPIESPNDCVPLQNPTRTDVPLYDLDCDGVTNDQELDDWTNPLVSDHPRD